MFTLRFIVDADIFPNKNANLECTINPLSRVEYLINHNTNDYNEAALKTPKQQTLFLKSNISG